MRVLLGIVVGLLIAVSVFWYLADQRASSPKAMTEAPTTDGDRSDGGKLEETRRDIERTFDPAEIREELSRTGQVVREKAREAGEFVGDVAKNAATTATIKTKLLQDPHTSGLAIDVDTTDGVVTLSGKVDSYEEIARAVDLALTTDGVYKVISALQVEEQQPAPP